MAAASTEYHIRALTTQTGEHKMAKEQRIEPRSETELREENREQLASEIEKSLTALHQVYTAAAKWMALEEFICQSDGPVKLVVVETEDIPNREPLKLVGVWVEGRKIEADFPDHVAVLDVQNQLDNFADDVMAAIAVENEKRRTDPRRIGTKRIDASEITAGRRT